MKHCSFLLFALDTLSFQNALDKPMGNMDITPSYAQQVVLMLSYMHMCNHSCSFAIPFVLQRQQVPN